MNIGLAKRYGGTSDEEGLVIRNTDHFGGYFTHTTTIDTFTLTSAGGKDGFIYYSSLPEKILHIKGAGDQACTANFQNSARIDISADDIYTYLFFPFDPSGTNGTPLSVGNYYYKQVNASYTSNFRKTFSYSGSASYGSYFTGNKFTGIAELNYRWQPYMALGIRGEYNQILLPKPYKSADLVLIGTTIEVTFTNNLFFTTFLQYNTQANNININSRLQWRFKPMSDLFLVYTENYATQNIGIKNRAVVLKLSYWLNI